MASNDISVSLKTNNLKDKDENLVLNFEGGSIISTGGNIKITQDGKTIEEIAIGGGKTSGGVYHSNSMVWDYEYNQIALVNDVIFKHLANHNNKKISDKTEEEWTTELRNDWKIAINGDLYSLAKRDQDLSSDDYYNYHETDPEYTPGVDKSGNGDVVLTPSSGIEQLIIDPSNLEDGGSYLIDLSDAGLISASDNSKDLLPAPLEINVGKSLTPTPSPSPAPTPTPTPTPTPPGEISELTADQLSKLSAKAVSALSAKQVKNLSADAVAEISPKAVKGFTAEQMENLPICAFMALRKRQLAKLSPDAVTGLTAQHLITLSSDEIGAFKATQIKSINPDAISSLKPSAAQVLFKSQALTNEQSAAIGEGQTNFTFNLSKAFKSQSDEILKKCGKAIELSVQSSQEFKSINSRATFKVKGLEIGLFAIAKNNNDLKDLESKDIDLIYHEKQGKLYLNDNLTGKGLGKGGGLLATFKNKPKLSHSQFSWTLSYDLHLKHDYQYGHNKKKYKSRGIKGTLDLFRENLTPRIKERLITDHVYPYGDGALSFYARGADLDEHERKDRARDEKLYMPLAMAFAFAQNPYVQIDDVSSANLCFYSDGSPWINVPMNDASCLYFQGV